MRMGMGVRMGMGMRGRRGRRDDDDHTPVGRKSLSSGGGEKSRMSLSNGHLTML